MLKKVWFWPTIFLVATIVIGLASTTGPPAAQTSSTAVLVVVQHPINHQLFAYEANEEVIHISPMLVTSERDCLGRLFTVNKHKQQMTQVQPTTANWRTIERTGTQAPIVRHAIYDQAIFAREPVPHWLRV